MSNQIKIQNTHEISWDNKYWFSNSASCFIIDFLDDNLPTYAKAFDRDSGTYCIDSEYLPELLEDVKEIEAYFERTKEEWASHGYTKEELTNELIEFIKELIEKSKQTGGYAYFDIF